MDGVQPAEAISIDVSQLGGMYAGKIHLVGTPTGVGVNTTGIRNKGYIEAHSGNLVLTADGRIENSGSLVAAKQAQITTATLDNQEGTISGSSLKLAVTTSLDNRQGVISTAGQLNLTVTETLDNRQGNITTGGQLKLAAATIDNSDGLLASQTSLELQANSLLNGKGTISGSDQLSLVATEALNNSLGSITARNAVELKAKNLNNTEGNISNGGQLNLTVTEALNNSQGTITTGDQLKLAAAKIDNRDGMLASQSTMSLQADSLLNDKGTINSRDQLNLTVTEKLSNNQGTIATQNAAKLQSKDLNNTEGTISSVDQLNLTVTEMLNNSQGTIVTGDQLKLAAAKIDNRDGMLASQSTLNLQADSLLNDKGTINSGNQLNLTVTEELSNSQGTIVTGDQLKLAAAKIDNRDGMLASQSTLSLQADSLLNDKGTINSGNQLNLTVTEELSNSLGTIAAQNAAELQAKALNNTWGSISNGGQLKLTATATLDNRQGNITTGGQLKLLAAKIDNSDGLVVSQSTLDLQADSLLNSQGTIASQSAAGLQVTDLNNTSGSIQSASMLNLSFNMLNNSQTQKNDQGIQAAELYLQGLEIINEQGSLLSSLSTTARISETLNNNGGLFSSSGHLQVQNIGSKLHITNEGGLLIADEQLDISAKTLAGAGDLVGLKDLNLELASAYTYKNGIYIGGDGRLTFHGAFNNDGLLQAGGKLTLSATDINNTIQGEITASDTHLKANLNLTNRGLINGENTHINASNLHNLGTGRIYGDQITLDLTNNLYNSKENNRAAVIASRNGLYAAFGNLYNSDDALLFSLGDMQLGGSLNNNGHVKSRASLIHNSGATIDAQGNLLLVAEKIENLNADFQTELVELRAPHEVVYIRPSSSEQLIPLSEFYWANWSRAGQYVHSATGMEVKDWTQYIVTESITETRVTHSAPGQILAGGNLTLNTSGLINDKSRILVGGSLTGDVNNLENRDAKGENIVFRSGTSQYTRGNWRGGVRRYHERDWHSVESYTPPPLVTTIDLSITELTVNTNTSKGSANHNISSVRTQAESQHHSGSLAGNHQADITLADINLADINLPNHYNVPSTQNWLDIRLPTNSLFNIHTAPKSQYLVETDPRFTNYKEWASSDHLLTKGDFVVTTKRLGDGFYEQQLIRDQLANLTGRRFLDGFSDDNAQYLHLMDNALAIADEWKLRPGIALTVDQVTALTRDIVWMVEQDITLPDGSVERVLVPRVYAKVNSEDLQIGGALISAGTVDLALTGNLTNSGALIGQRELSVSASNISNLGGRIGGNSIDLSAKENFTMLAGLIQGRDKVKISAGKNLEVSSTQTSGETYIGGNYFSHTSMDQQAGIRVTGETGSLSLAAGQNMTLAAANIENKGSGDTLLQADGDILITSLETETTRNTVTDSKNFQKLSSSEHQASNISVAGNLQLVAGGNAHIHASELNAKETLSVQAESIAITAGINQSSLHEASETTTRSRRKTEDIGHLNQTGVASQLNGGNIQLLANNTIRISGSNLNASENLTIGNMTVEQQEDGSFKAVNGEGTPDQLIVDTLELQNENWHNRSTSYRGAVATVAKAAAVFTSVVLESLALDVDKPEFTLSKSSSERSSSTTHQGSELDAGKNLVMAAKEQIQIISGELNALGDAILSATNITLAAAQETHTTESSYSRESVGGVSASISEDEINLGGVELTKETHTERTTSTTHKGSSINAGNLVMLADQDISILGSQVNVEGAAILQAQGDILIGGYEDKTVTETHEETETTRITAGVRNAYVDAGLAVQAVYEAVKAADDANSAYQDAKRRVERGELSESALEDYRINRAAAVAQLAQAQIAAGTAVAGAATAASGSMGTGFYASVSAEHTQTRTQTSKTEGQWQGSAINAGSLTLNSTNATIQGSDITAGLLNLGSKNVLITAGLNETHTQQSSSTDTKTARAGTNGSASVGTSNQQSNSQSSSSEYVNSRISVGHLQSNSENFTLQGANVQTQTASLNVGNLTVASLQDTASSTNSSRGSSAGVGFGSGGVSSVNAGYNQNKGNSEGQEVNNQTQLLIADSANSQITAQHTSLIGGLIANATQDENGQLQDHGQLNLSTQTLSVSHLDNKTSSQQSGFGIQTSVGTQTNENGVRQGSTTLSLQNQGHITEGLAQATLGGGNIQVGGQKLDDNNSPEGLNRDLSQSQIIIRDQQTGGLNAGITVDHRLLTEKGRDEIIQEQKDFGDNSKRVIGGATGDLARIGAVVGSTLDLSLDQSVNAWKTVGKGQELAYTQEGALAGNVEDMRDGNILDGQTLQGGLQEVANFINPEDGQQVRITEGATNTEGKAVYGAAHENSNTMFVDIEGDRLNSLVNTVAHEGMHLNGAGETNATATGYLTDFAYRVNAWANSGQISEHRVEQPIGILNPTAGW